MYLWALVIPLSVLVFIFTLTRAATNNSDQLIYTLITGDIITPKTCSYVNHLAWEERCQWVKELEDCKRTDDSFISYTPFLFCKFASDTLQYVGAFIMLLWLLCLFVILGTTADQFFCPSLAVLASALKLSQNVAGVTVLAFGNGAPDIFTTIKGVEIGETEMVYNEIMGGGLFITLMVIGVLCIKTPFRVEGSLFLRDCIFYIVTILWTYWLLKRTTMKLWQSLSYIILYGVYLAFVIGEQRVEKRRILRRTLYNQYKKIEHEPEEVKSREGSKLLINAVNSVAPSVSMKTRSTSRTALRDLAIHFERMSLMSELNIDEYDGRVPEHEEEVEQSCGLVKEFLHEMIPLDVEEWKTMTLWEKIFSCMQAPFILVLKLVIPVVNYTAVNNGWCKLLNIINCITLPLYAVIATQNVTTKIRPGIPVIAIAAVISVILATVVTCTSSRRRPPAYHSVFAFFGFVGSVLTVYLVASEVVSVLNSVGILFTINDSTLGITVLAWGNSIGDFITTISLASAGFPRMGFAGCYGGPLFNLLLGFGLALTMKAISNGIEHGGYEVKVETGDLTGNIVLYMLSGLCSSLILLPTMGFEARRPFGFYLIFIYAMFTLRAFLIEFEVIHPLDSLYYQEAAYPNGTTVSVTKIQRPS